MNSGKFNDYNLYAGQIATNYFSCISYFKQKR